MKVLFPTGAMAAGAAVGVASWLVAGTAAGMALGPAAGLAPGATIGVTADTTGSRSKVNRPLEWSSGAQATAMGEPESPTP